jgi:hypothetical protein
MSKRRAIEKECDNCERRGMVGQVKFVRITPELTRRWLEKLDLHKHYSRKRVDKFVEIIQRGLWCPSASMFHFADDGTLINGEHRLRAIVQSGITACGWVMTGLTKDAFHYVDTEVRGRTRSCQ